MSLRDLLVGGNVANSEKGDFRETQILVIVIHPDRHHVRHARVIEEATHIAVIVCIDAVL